MDEKQLKQCIAILKQRIDQLKLVHNESVNIQFERVKQQQSPLNKAGSRLDKLTVRAGFDGVSQRLSVELRSLAAGQEVALIGSVTDLFALICEPQSQAQLNIIGKVAIIDTRRHKIEGVGSRIDPIVDNNTVELEIALPASLPASVRPQLSVDGMIVAGMIVAGMIVADTSQHITYIKRPEGAK